MKKIINPWKDMEGYNCFGCAPNNDAGLKMEFYEDNDEVFSRWKPRSCFQGWIDTLHGGIQATILDEICAWTVFRKLQTAGVTCKMETRYLKPISTKQEYITVKASIISQKRNIVTLEAIIYNFEGEACTKAICSYFTYTKEQAAQKFSFVDCKLQE